MKNLKEILEGSILADVEDTLNVTGAKALCKTIENGLLSNNASKQKKAAEELKGLVKDAGCKELNSIRDVKDMKVHVQFDYKGSWGGEYDFMMFWTNADMLYGVCIEKFGKSIIALHEPMSFAGHMINPKISKLYNLSDSKYKDVFDTLNENLFKKAFTNKK